MAKNPILVAIDTPEIPRAKSLAEAAGPHVGGIKLGLEFFVANGAQGVQEVSSGNVPVFLDLKFHDIPNTVAKAIAATAGIDCFLMTIHTSGGPEMMRRAAQAAEEIAQQTGRAKPQVVGVTLLTSLDQSDISAIGYGHALEDQAKRLASLAQENGLDGIVCSPHEITLIRDVCGPDFTLVVPGIRPAGADTGDQKRTLTPKEALERGADYLVIGRPITQAENPAEAAKNIALSLA